MYNRVCRLKYYYCLLLFSLFSISKCDLPIHTLTKDIIGVWKIYETDLNTNFQNCGSTYPNKNVENLKIDNFKSYLIEIYGELKENVIELSNERYFIKSLIYPRNQWSYLSVKNLENHQIIGHWTLVYDEGVMIEIGDKNYFGYFKYNNIKNNDCKQITQNINEDTYGNIKCYETDPTKLQIGWYSKNTKNNFKFGCFYLEKLYNYKNHNDDNDLDRNRLNKNYIIDLTSVNYKYNLNNNFKNFNSFNSNTNNNNSNNNVGNNRKWDAINVMNKLYSGLTPYRFIQLNKGVNYYPVHNFNLSNDTSSNTSSTRLNNNTLESVDTNDYTVDNTHPCNNNSLNLLSSTDKLPRNWTWGDPFNGMDEDPYTSSQGECGSCYVLSSLYVISKRFQIMFNKLYPNNNFKMKHFVLDTNDILNSAYNQGCYGGFLMLVGKHSKELGIKSDHFYGYNTSNDNDNSNMDFISKNSVYDNKWYLKKFGYVGGCYECSNELNMMNEIYLNGPISVAIYCPNQLFYHTNGWEYTNHAIAIVGWGEEMIENKRTKYWICKNTWGTGWGVNGYFKIQKGVNLLGIESQAVYFDPNLNRGLALHLIDNYISK